MAACGQENRCPTCGDRLNHQRNKGAHESSSVFGQFIHDTYGNDFYYCDIDGAGFKNATRILRISEYKEPGQSLSPGQQTILPLLAEGIQHLVKVGRVDPQSGVFRVRWVDNTVARFIDIREIGTSLEIALQGEDMDNFLTCRRVEGFEQ